MLHVAGRRIPDTLEEIAAPGRTALLLWDMHGDLEKRAFNCRDIVPRLHRLTQAARTAGVPVYYSLQNHFDLATEETAVWVRLRMKNEQATASAHAASESDGNAHRFVDELAPQPGDHVFTKRRANGFEGTDLDLSLRYRGIGTVLVAGISTEGGVEVTARCGLTLGYYMVVLRDCVGSRRPEMRELALEFMEKTHLDITTADEVMACWGRARRSPDCEITGAQGKGNGLI
jgi:nicotinamidase-related amidase